MDETGSHIMLSKISQNQKDKYPLFFHIWNLDLKKKNRCEGELGTTRGTGKPAGGRKGEKKTRRENMRRVHDMCV
jgi:hypothetical protein